MGNSNNTSSLELIRENGWLTIWFNRPDTRNCLSEAVMNVLITTMEEIRDENNLRGVMFRGKGGIFCAGGDLKEFEKFGEIDNLRKAKEVAVANSHIAAKFFKTIRNLPQVTVSVVEGPAMAGGFALACATDFLVTMNDAKFSLTETRIGLTPAQIAPYVVQRLGFAMARRLMLLACIISGKDAHEIGLADFIAYDQNKLEQTLVEIRKLVQSCSPNAIAATKTALSATYEMGEAECAKLSAEIFSICLISEDGKEGFRSFMEKRKPKWDDKAYKFRQQYSSDLSNWRNN